MRRLPRSARKKPRVLFYSHDGLGLGHFRLTLAVAASLARREPGASRLLLTGLPNAGAFEFPETLDYVRMPGVDKNHLFEANPAKEAGAPSSVFSIRKRVIAATFESFAPHLFVVDQSPVGLADELLPVLRQSGRKRDRPMCVLGLRDIVFEPERTRQLWQADGTYDLLENAYDLILVYGSPLVFDPIVEYQFPPSVAAKTRFTGYLSRPEPLQPSAVIREELGAHDGPLIVVSAGGGKDGAALIKAFLKAVQRGDLSAVTASLVTGPQMPPRQVAKMADLAAPLPGVTLVPFRRDLVSHVAAADVVVTMGGYNSVWEAIGAGKRPIIVPRRGGGDEQILRAERLAALGLATVVLPEQLAPERLADAIREELGRTVTPVRSVDFDGFDTTGKALSKLLRRRLDGAKPVGSIGQSPLPSAKKDGRRKSQITSRSTAGASATPRGSTPRLGLQRGSLDADVIICVHDAVEDVRRCLTSFVAHTDSRHHLLIVDDASGPVCREELSRFAAGHSTVVLHRNEERLGYTRSANWGLRHSRAGFVVLLNSDTIVTPDWLERLIACAESDPRIGIVGPLSNSATFQSIPERYDNDRNWITNVLPPGWAPDDVAAAVAAIAPRTYPRVGVLNGFCLAIKRAVIDAIGYLDERSFPDGYGEEVDYCLRAVRAGYTLAVADHAYVYHAANRSYGPDQRQALKLASQAAHVRKHKAKRIRAAITKTYNEPTLEWIRIELTHRLATSYPPESETVGAIHGI